MSDAERAFEGGELLWSVQDGTGRLTLNRPERRNALTMAMYDGIAARCAAPGPDVRTLLISGAGGAFAAGTDMTQFRAFETEDDALGYEARMDHVMGAVERCPVPTVAAIDGACTGGGAAIAAACDIRIATGRLKFGFPIARTLGNALSIANLARLSALIGPGRVKEIVLTARLVEADEALRVGLVSEVVADPEALERRVLELARTLKGHAPITMRVTKEGLRRLRLQGAEADDRDLILAAYMSRDFKEGIEAFLGKRKARWKGE